MRDYIIARNVGATFEVLGLGFRRLDLATIEKASISLNCLESHFPFGACVSDKSRSSFELDTVLSNDVSKRST